MVSKRMPRVAFGGEPAPWFKMVDSFRLLLTMVKTKSRSLSPNLTFFARSRFGLEPSDRGKSCGSIQGYII